MQYPTQPPESPVAGDAWADIQRRTVNVYDGTKWIVFTEVELIEMEITQLLIQAGHSEEAATQMLHILKHHHGENHEAH